MPNDNPMYEPGNQSPSATDATRADSERPPVHANQPVPTQASTSASAGPLYDLLHSASVTPATREVLLARLEALNAPWPNTGAFFSAAELATLRAAIARLVPQDHRERPVDIAIQIDQRLAAGRSDGWRPAILPNDGEAYRLALRGFDEYAQERHGMPFAELNGLQQDALLTLVQRGKVQGPSWESLDSEVFFTEMLAEVTEVYFSDPIAQIEIGYVGFADQPAWTEIGLNRRDLREPVRPTRRHQTEQGPA